MNKDIKFFVLVLKINVYWENKTKFNVNTIRGRVDGGKCGEAKKLENKYEVYNKNTVKNM